jgi:hypothetical protein
LIRVVQASQEGTKVLKIKTAVSIIEHPDFTLMAGLHSSISAQMKSSDLSGLLGIASPRIQEDFPHRSQHQVPVDRPLQGECPLDQHKQYHKKQKSPKLPHPRQTRHKSNLGPGQTQDQAEGGKRLKRKDSMCKVVFNIYLHLRMLVVCGFC